MSTIEEESARLTSLWMAEKDKLGRAADIKKQLDDARNELAIAPAQGRFQKAGEIAYGRIPELEAQLKAAETQEDKGTLVEETVTPEHIAHIVSRWTGIPVDKMLEGEREKLLRDGRRARQAGRRPGRGGAGRLEGRAPRPRRACRTRTGRSARSCSSGPTGVGKTELTKALADYPVRRRARAGAHRHVGVHGEALGRPADRRASRLCRL